MKINKLKFLPTLLIAPTAFCTINTTVACNKVLSYRVAAPYDTGVNVKTSDFTKVYVIAGQSNAEGCSQVSSLKSKIPPEEFSVYEAGYSKVQIANSKSKETPTETNFAPTTCRFGTTTDHFGPELGFAEIMNKRSSADVYIIKYAVGGTALYDEWLDGNGNRGKLYSNMISFVKSEITKVPNTPLIAGFCWMQGESDGTFKKAKKYSESINNLLAYFKADLSLYINPKGLTFVDAGIGTQWAYYDKINGAKIEFSKTSDWNGYFSTTENGLVSGQAIGENNDNAHYSALSELQLGRWFALKSIELFNKKN